MTTRKLFSAEVMVAATVYIVADDEAEATAKIQSLIEGATIEAGESDDFSGARYDSPDFPEVSLSPSMTISTTMADLKVEFHDEVDVQGDH